MMRECQLHCDILPACFAVIFGLWCGVDIRHFKAVGTRCQQQQDVACDTATAPPRDGTATNLTCDTKQILARPLPPNRDTI